MGSCMDGVSPWPSGAGQGGRRHQVLCRCSRAASVLPLTQAPRSRMDPALTTAWAALLELCTAPHHQLRGSPWESTGLPTASPSSWPWQMPLLCAGTGSSCSGCLVLLGFSACPRRCVQDASGGGMSCWEGTAPGLRLGSGSAARREGDGSCRQ